MSKQEEDIDLIEKYLDGESNAEERALFARKLNEDPDFAKLYKLRQSLPRILADATGYEKTKEEIGKLLLENEKQPLRLIRSPYFYAIAAGFIILFGTFTLLFIIDKPEKAPMNSENKSGENDSLVILEPEIQQKKATVKKYPGEEIKTEEVKPRDGWAFGLDDDIIFKWDTTYDSSTHLYILSKKIDKLILKIEVKSRQDSIIIPANKIGSGEFYWYIGKKKVTQSFSIKN